MRLRFEALAHADDLPQVLALLGVWELEAPWATPMLTLDAPEVPLHTIQDLAARLCSTVVVRVVRSRVDP